MAVEVARILEQGIAWIEISNLIDMKNLESLSDLDEADFVGALVGLLVDAGVENPEELLIRAGILE